MNPVQLALRHPVTVIVLLVGLVGAGGLAMFGPPATRMKADVFPALNIPVVYVCQPYGGMDPQQMEGLIANYYEYHSLYIGGIHHVESRNVQGVCLVKLYFHPGTDMAQAMAETVATTNRSRSFMPPGTVPPFIMRFDTGSVPVGYLVLSSETKTIGQIQDQALFRVRPMFSAIQGVSAPPPFGGNARTIVIRVDPGRLTATNISADDVVAALSKGNAISPSGAIRELERMPFVPVNSMAATPKDFGDIPIKPGVFIRDVVVRNPATGDPLIEDATDFPTGYALVNGKRAVYILATKRAEAGTLEVVNSIKANLPRMQAALPDDIKVSFELDQSPFVADALAGVRNEAILGAVLTGLMVLLFLRDWRSMVVVVLNIPLALIASLVALWLAGQSINLMTLGGLALAVGILVDESTVEVENIHTQMGRTKSVALAVRRGNHDTAVPRFLAMLCILAVFIPSFLMEGSARALFRPLALAVGFAMIGSYILSSTFVPIMSVWLLRHGGEQHDPGQSVFAWLLRPAVWLTTKTRWLLVPAYLGTAGLLLGLGWQAIGTDIFPQVDTGQFQFRLKAPPGTRIEQTEEIVKEALNVIQDEAGADNVEITVGYVGVVPPSNPVNSIYLWTGGPDEAVFRVALKPGRVPLENLKARLRDRLNEHLPKWLERKWLAEGVPPGRAAAARNIRLSYEPADIVNEVMSFGSPTPIEIQVSSTKMSDNREYAEKIRQELAKVSGITDLQYVQTFDYPTVDVSVNRERAAGANVQAGEVGAALAPATSSSRFTVPNYWRDPASGISYQVQVEVPQDLMKSPSDVGKVPVRPNGGTPVLVRDVADVKEGTMPGQFDRYNQRRLVSLTANIQGTDLGSVARDVSKAIEAAGKAPQGVNVDVRGQVAPMNELFNNLAYGLLAAVVVILLLLLAYFQSVRLALTAVAGVPAVLCGVLGILLATGTTINLQSFMGAIMAVGVAVANAILFVTFAERARLGGEMAGQAALSGVRVRVRPILMTSAAMIAGMVPMALLGSQSAPLGRAVIGGLVAGTAATVILLPAMFALLMGGAGRTSMSLDPFDPASRHHVPGEVSA